MKTILALSLLIFSQFLFAGNSVGTMSQTQEAFLKSDSDFNKALNLSKTTESWIVVGSVTPEKQQCIDSCIASFEKPGPELKACVVSVI